MNGFCVGFDFISIQFYIPKLDGVYISDNRVVKVAIIRSKYKIIERNVPAIIAEYMILHLSSPLLAIPVDKCAYLNLVKRNQLHTYPCDILRLPFVFRLGSFRRVADNQCIERKEILRKVKRFTNFLRSVRIGENCRPHSP